MVHQTVSPLRSLGFWLDHRLLSGVPGRSLMESIVVWMAARCMAGNHPPLLLQGQFDEEFRKLV